MEGLAMCRRVTPHQGLGTPLHKAVQSHVRASHCCVGRLRLGGGSPWQGGAGVNRPPARGCPALPRSTLQPAHIPAELLDHLLLVLQALGSLAQSGGRMFTACGLMRTHRVLGSLQPQPVAGCAGPLLCTRVLSVSCTHQLCARAKSHIVPFEALDPL